MSEENHTCGNSTDEKEANVKDDYLFGFRRELIRLAFFEENRCGFPTSYVSSCQWLVLF